MFAFSNMMSFYLHNDKEYYRDCHRVCIRSLSQLHLGEAGYTLN